MLRKGRTHSFLSKAAALADLSHSCGNPDNYFAYCFSPSRVSQIVEKSKRGKATSLKKERR